MFSSTLYVYFLAAFGAAGLVSNGAIAYVIDNPDGPKMEVVPASESNALTPDFVYNATDILALDRNNLTTCPCSIIGSVVPAAEYLTKVLECIIDALLIYPSDLESFCQEFAELFLAIYILPSGRKWSVCAGCSNCYNPACTIWITIQLNVFGGIVLKIYN